MSSQPKPGKTGPDQTIAVIAVIALVPYADRAWVTVFLGVIVAYAIAEDWSSHRR